MDLLEVSPRLAPLNLAHFLAQKNFQKQIVILNQLDNQSNGGLIT
jgi:hypothetical protein